MADRDPPFIVALRSLVMLAALVAIPVIAAGGTAQPKIREAIATVRELVEGQIHRWRSSNAAPPTESAEGGPFAGPAAAGAADTASGHAAWPAIGSAATDAAWGHGPARPRPLPASPEARPLADARSTGGSSGGGRSEGGSSGGGGPNGSWTDGGWPDGGTRPAIYEESAPTGRQPPTVAWPSGAAAPAAPAAVAPAAAAPVAPVAPAATATTPAGPLVRVERFGDLERRLRELGASYYRLESWGAAGEMYRFQCWMSLQGDPGANRYFEAKNTDPLQSMSEVLQQVEAWRAQPRH